MSAVQHDTHAVAQAEFIRHVSDCCMYLERAAEDALRGDPHGRNANMRLGIGSIKQAISENKIMAEAEVPAQKGRAAA